MFRGDAIRHAGTGAAPGRPRGGSANRSAHRGGARSASRRSLWCGTRCWGFAYCSWSFRRRLLTGGRCLVARASALLFRPLPLLFQVTGALLAALVAPTVMALFPVTVPSQPGGVIDGDGIAERHRDDRSYARICPVNRSFRGGSHACASVRKHRDCGVIRQSHQLQVSIDCRPLDRAYLHFSPALHALGSFRAVRRPLNGASRPTRQSTKLTRTTHNAASPPKAAETPHEHQPLARSATDQHRLEPAQVRYSLCRRASALRADPHRAEGTMSTPLVSEPLHATDDAAPLTRSRHHGSEMGGGHRAIADTRGRANYRPSQRVSL